MGQLSVVVSGICAFTPGSPQGSGSVGNELTFVLPDGRAGGSAQSGPIAQHVPFIIYPLASAIGASTRLPDQVTPGGFGVIVLDREIVDVTPPSSDPLSFVQGVVGPKQRPDTGEQNDVFWIADMRRVWPTVAAIRSDCRPGSTVSPSVVAQLRFRGGTVASRLDSVQSVYTFTPVKVQQVRQVLSSYVELAMPFAGSTAVTLQFNAFDTGASRGQLVLNVPATGTVELRIGNMPQADFVAWLGGQSGVSDDAFDADFELYYSILSPPAGAELSIPRQQGEGVFTDCRPLMTE